MIKIDKTKFNKLKADIISFIDTPSFPEGHVFKDTSAKPITEKSNRELTELYMTAGSQKEQDVLAKELETRLMWK